MGSPCTGIFARFRGDLLENEPLSRHTSLKVGGPSDLFAVPADREALVQLVSLCRENRVKWMILGGGYNTLVRDGGFRGVTVSLAQMTSMTRLPENRICAQAGMHNQQLVKLLATEGLSGLEFLAGIPGSIGGALAMNAGCHGHEVMERLESMTIVDGAGVRAIPAQELAYGYRFLNLDAGTVIVDALFALTPDDPAAISSRGEDFREKRRGSQQVGYPNAGSFFKNPQDAQAWRLIEAAGLRGARIGGAQVSEQHANFLVNRGGATAADFLELSRVIKEKVKMTSGVELEEEVKIVGEG